MTADFAAPAPAGKVIVPILLFNDECSVCRHIAAWVKRAAGREGTPSIVERPIGEDPRALRLLNPNLTIWDAYATIHLLMPDGSMKLGGEAVAEVLRRIPSTRWLARSFSLTIFGARPFQKLLDLAYEILADVRPLFGCESCGAPRPWVRPIVRGFQWLASLFGGKGKPSPAPRSTARPPRGALLAPIASARLEMPGQRSLRG